MRRALIILLGALLLAAAPGAQAQNPFTGEAAPPQQQRTPANPFTGSPPAPAAGPVTVTELGPLDRLNRALARFQRDVTREMAARLRAIRDGETPLALLVGIGLAFAYGVVHAAGPGHGKAVVIGYFLTRQARVGRGLLMGLQISVGHVVSAIVVAVAADLVFKTVWGTSAADLRGVQLASYAAIAVIGTWMLVQTARGRRHHHHDHHGHAHGHAHGHTDAHGHPDGGHRPQGLLALGVGVVPCTGAILVMLFALANGILLAGFVLVAAIAAGMTMTMAALGVLAIVARNAVTRWATREETAGRIGTALEYAGAIAIILIGVTLFWLAY